VVERRGAVALAYHFRQAEGLSIAQIAARLGRSGATVKAYLSEPAGYVELRAERQSRIGHSTDVVGIGFVHPRFEEPQERVWRPVAAGGAVERLVFASASSLRARSAWR
jgi:hypothetical protein